MKYICKFTLKVIYYYLSILIELPKHKTLQLPNPDEYEFRKVYKIQVYFI